MAQEQADIIGLGDCTDTSMVVHVSSALKCLLAVHRVEVTHTHKVVTIQHPQLRLWSTPTGLRL